MDSTTRLVKALEGNGSHKLRGTIRKAKRNDFNDFLSDSATPIHDLVTELRALGFPKLAQRAINGEFDATKEEADAWAKSDEGRLAFAELTGGLDVPRETEG